MNGTDYSKRWLALALVCIGDMMIVIDATVVNVALPSIQRDLGFSQSGLAWVVNAFLLTFGGFMLLAGRAADLLGRRRLMIAGLVLFGAASLACGLAQSQAVLIAARAIQGMGGAIVTSVALSLVVALFVDEGERAKAMGIWGFVASGGGSLGVIAGGLVVQSLDWHWIFLLNVPIAIAAVVLSKPLLPELPGIGIDKGVDLAGAVLVTMAPLLATYALVNTEHAGWTSPETLGWLAAALVAVILFVVVERRLDTPLVPLGVFKSRTIAVSNIVMVLSGAAMFGWFFFSPQYLQRFLRLDALEVGLTFLPAMVLMGALSLGASARLVGRFGAKAPVIAGQALMSLGMLLLARAPADGSLAVDVIPAMLLMGIGAGIAFMPMMLVATSEADPAQSGLVSGLATTSQMLGGAVGLAVLASISASYSGALIATGTVQEVATLDGYHLAFLVGGVIGLAGTLLSLLLPKATVTDGHDQALDHELAAANA